MNPMAVITLTIKNFETLVVASQGGVIALFAIALFVTATYVIVRQKPLDTLMLFAWSPVACILIACVVVAIKTLAG